VRLARVREYPEKFTSEAYTEAGPAQFFNPLWNYKADCAFPSATLSGINAKDAQDLENKGVTVANEGTTCPRCPKALVFTENKPPYCPGKAANGGGVSVPGLEMTQDSLRL